MNQKDWDAIKAYIDLRFKFLDAQRLAEIADRPNAGPDIRAVADKVVTDCEDAIVVVEAQVQTAIAKGQP